MAWEADGREKWHIQCFRGGTLLASDSRNGIVDTSVNSYADVPSSRSAFTILKGTAADAESDYKCKAVDWGGLAEQNTELVVECEYFCSFQNVMYKERPLRLPKYLVLAALTKFTREMQIFRP